MGDYRPGDAPGAMPPALRLALVGLSGSGKSTCARMLRDRVVAAGGTAEILKLAEPLYRVQRLVYELAGDPERAHAQDQRLLYDIATHLRRINPRSLVDDFAVRLARTTADLVVNDDLRDRDVDLPALRDLGFRIVRVVCDEEVRRARLGNRDDTTTLDERAIWSFDDIDADDTLDTTGGDRGELSRRCAELLTSLHQGVPR